MGLLLGAVLNLKSHTCAILFLLRLLKQSKGILFVIKSKYL